MQMFSTDILKIMISLLANVYESKQTKRHEEVHYYRESHTSQILLIKSKPS